MLLTNTESKLVLVVSKQKNGGNHEIITGMLRFGKEHHTLLCILKLFTKINVVGNYL